MIPEYDDLGYIASSSCTSYSSDDDSSIDSNNNYTILQDKYDVQTLHKIKSNKDYNCLTSFLDLPPLNKRIKLTSLKPTNEYKNYNASASNV